MKKISLLLVVALILPFLGTTITYAKSDLSIIEQKIQKMSDESLIELKELLLSVVDMIEKKLWVKEDQSKPEPVETVEAPKKVTRVKVFDFKASQDTQSDNTFKLEWGKQKLVLQVTKLNPENDYWRCSYSIQQEWGGVWYDYTEQATSKGEYEKITREPAGEYFVDFNVSEGMDCIAQIFEEREVQ